MGAHGCEGEEDVGGKYSICSVGSGIFDLAKNLKVKHLKQDAAAAQKNSNDRRRQNRMLLFLFLSLLLVSVIYGAYQLAVPSRLTPTPTGAAPSIGTPAAGTSTPAAAATTPAPATPTYYPTAAPAHFPFAGPVEIFSASTNTSLAVDYGASSTGVFLRNDQDQDSNQELFAFFGSEVLPESFASLYSGSLQFSQYSPNTYYSPVSVPAGFGYDAGSFLGPIIPLIFTMPAYASSDGDEVKDSYSNLVEPVLSEYSQSLSDLYPDQQAAFNSLVNDMQSAESDLMVREQLRTALEKYLNEAKLRRALEAGQCSAGVAGLVDATKRQFHLVVPLKGHEGGLAVSISGTIKTSAHEITIAPENPGPDSKSVSIIFDYFGVDFGSRAELAGEVNVGYSQGEICTIPVRITVGAEASYGTTGSNSYSGSYSGAMHGLLDPPVYPRVTCEWGFYTGHRGIDFGVPMNTPVRAPADGIILTSATGWNNGYGNFMRMDNGVYEGKHIYTLYGHLTSFAKKPGDEVKRGDVIAYTDNTGRSTGPHLHFEVLVNSPWYGAQVNPRQYLKIG